MVPSVTAPFGMTQWSPMTRQNRVSVKPYAYEDAAIEGFIGTHQPAIWMGDFGYVSVMPGVGAVRAGIDDRKLPFSHDRETSTPHYYAVDLDAGSAGTITAEMTATERAGLLRFTYPGGAAANFTVQATRAGIDGYIEVDPQRREIVGYNPDRQDHNLGPLALPNFKGYFVVQIDTAFAGWGTYNADATFAGQSSRTDAAVGGYVTFSVADQPLPVLVKIGTSFISVEQARANLHAEIPGWDLSGISNKLRDTWNEKLSTIEIEGATDAQRRIFYTGMFHALQFPSEFSEYGRYYSAFDDSVHDGSSYTGYSIWDTFRAENSLLTLIAPERIDGMMQSLLQNYQQGGWLPMWPNPSYTNIMIGTHADSLIAEAVNKGFHGFDWNLAYAAVHKDATVPPDRDTELRYSDRQPHTPFEARAGLTYEKQIGYVPADRTAEAGSRTLEYCYDDYAVAQLAKAVGNNADYEFFLARSRNYRNLYNASTGFMQARNLDGSWASGGWTEGDQWSYSFCVMHDIPGLVDLMGRDHFISLLDRNFSEGHENHSNEPDHHYPYLYDYVGQQWKTAQQVRAVAAANYFDSIKGLTGNEDCGQMSAWYILSALGFYPVDPVSGRYAIGSPFFTKATINLGRGKKFVITAEANSPANLYIQSASLNGTPLDTPFIDYADIVRGGTMDFTMAATPSAWATGGTAVPTTNLALGKPAQMIGGDGRWGGPERAVDGNTATYAQPGENSLWDLQVDLGAAVPIAAIYLDTDPSNYASAYTLRVSTDASTWQTVVTETAGDGTPKTYPIPTVTARYILLDVTAVHGGGATYGHAVRELQVFNAT